MPKFKICSKCKENKLRDSKHFNKRKDSKDGLQGICRVCTVKRQRELRSGKEKEIAEYQKNYRNNNIEKLRSAHAEYYQANKEKLDDKNREYYNDNKEQIVEYHKRYYKANKERLSVAKRKYYNDNKSHFNRLAKEHYSENKSLYIERARDYSERNPELVTIYKQRWRIKNKEVMNEHGRNYRRGLKRLPNTFSIDAWFSVKKYFNYSCAYCGMTEGDHGAKFNEQLHQEHFIPLSKGGEYTHNNIIVACRSCNSSKGNKDFFEWYPKQEYYNRDRERLILEYLGYENNTQQLSIL